MTARTEYFRNALSRADGNRVLLSKLSAIPLSNGRDRKETIDSAKDMQSHIQMNLAKLVITKPKTWKSHVAAIDRDFELLEDTLEKLWANPLGRCYQNTSRVDRIPGN